MENFKPSIRNGLILGTLGIIVFLLVWSFAPEMFASFSWGITQMVLIMIALPIVFMIIGTRDTKEKFERFNYGQAFYAAFLVGLLAVFLNVGFNLVFHSAIDPGFNERLQEKVSEQVLERLENANMDDAAIEKQMAKMEQRFEGQKGVLGQLKGGLYLLLWYTVLALIIAAVYKDKKSEIRTE